jgi:UDP-N-acetylglucosamine diphosphorylase / glucose-1-phosphate thymidylyltransferase / UDP-N-acetylgalactosamine diphosphorylase / glucosamine-1-phosphate N-acetyltransferase / galactosamine-1-phosphate N-acetyltransferase
MRAHIVNPGRPESCRPLTATRDLLQCRVADATLGEVIARRLLEAGFEHSGPNPRETAGAFSVWVRGDAWLSAETLDRLRRAAGPCVLYGAGGREFAWIGVDPSPPTDGERLSSSPDDFPVLYAWDLLRVNEIVLDGLTADRILGEVADGVRWEGRLHLGAGSRLLPGVHIEGNAIVGRDCKIGPNCYLRGATTIGDRCRIGHAVEIKNSIIGHGTSIGHLSYCGDSILGEGVNFGAGTITANLRHDGAPQRCMIDGTPIDTGRKKFGAVVGDGVHTGIHTGIYPGRTLGPNATTRPGELVRRNIP